MLDTSPYLIPSWSGKVIKARKHHRCENCGGIIIAGTKYARDVVRLGTDKARDARRNLHYHLDCEAPWYQGEVVHRTKHIGKLPGGLPPETIAKPGTPYLAPAVAASSNQIGTVQWKLPEHLATRLVHNPNSAGTIGAVAEYEALLAIVLEGAVLASGHQRIAMRLSHLVNEIAELVHNMRHLHPE